MKIFDKSTPTSPDEVVRQRTDIGERLGLAPVEMTLVLVPLMLLMAAMVAFGFNACWKLRSEVVARDVAWRNLYPHEGSKNPFSAQWSANQHTRNPEFPVARPGVTVLDGTGRREIARWDTQADSDLTIFENDDVIHAPIIRGPIPNVNVNSDLLDFAGGVELGEAIILRKPNVLPKLGQIEYHAQHTFVGDSFQYGKMRLKSHPDVQYFDYNEGWSNYVRRIPYIYRTDIDFFNDMPAYQAAIARVEAARRPLCLAIDEEALFFGEFGKFSDRHPAVRSFSSTDRDYVRRNYVEGDQGVKLRITGGVTAEGRRVRGVPFRLASKFISIWLSRIARATTEREKRVYREKIEALKSYQNKVK